MPKRYPAFFLPLLTACEILLGGGMIVQADSFRPPAKSIAVLSDEQRLSLVVSEISQQLVYGTIPDDNLAVLRSASGPKRAVIHPPLVAATPRPLPTGTYTGMSQGTPLLRGRFAHVPVLHHFQQKLDKPPWERVRNVADTLIFVDGGTGWRLSAAEMRDDSPLWELAKRATVGGKIGGGGLTASVGTVNDFQNLFVDSLLLPKSIHANADVLNSLSSSRLFNTDIIGVPSGVCANSFYGYTEGHHDFLGVSDMSWSRILGAEEQDSWITSTGSPGSGPLQFSMPMGMCGFGHGFLIADAMNNRVVQVNITITNGHATGLNDTCYFTGCFNYPTDVDYRDTVPGDPYPARLIADNGNGQIVQIRGPATCTNAERIGTKGSGYGQFLNPISVCYGRNWSDHMQNRNFYVADRGNHRVTKVEWIASPTPGHYDFSSFDLGYDADVVAVDVDNFGLVYALDAAQGILYKFDASLGPIAAYRFQVDDGQVFYPHDFSIAHGIQWSESAYGYVPVVLGDAFLTQNYTGATGVHRFALGVEVLRDSARYIMRTQTDTDFVRIDYYLTDYANVTIDVRKNGVLRCHMNPILQGNGFRARLWYPDSTDPSGNYTIEVHAASLYSNSNTHTVSIPLTIDRSYVNHGALIVSGPNLDCSGCVCVRGGNPWGYGVNVVAYDQDNDSLQYVWHCLQGEFANHRDTVTTDSNRVRYYPYATSIAGTSPSGGGVEPLPTVSVRVTDSHGYFAFHQTTFGLCAQGQDDGCCCCTNQGDVAENDGILDVFDVIKLIGIAFSGDYDVHDSDCPISRGDVNYDLATDVFDVVYIIATAFSGSASPVNPCITQSASREYLKHHVNSSGEPKAARTPIFIREGNR